MEQSGTGKLCGGRCEDKVVVTRTDRTSWQPDCCSLCCSSPAVSDEKYLALFQLKGSNFWRVKSIWMW